MLPTHEEVSEMLDPFRGELTARYIQSENLAWAASERLAREARAARVPRRLDVEARLGRLLRWRRESPAREPRREAA